VSAVEDARPDNCHIRTDIRTFGAASNRVLTRLRLIQSLTGKSAQNRS
jgi:hypothetical protein